MLQVLQRKLCLVFSCVLVRYTVRHACYMRYIPAPFVRFCNTWCNAWCNASVGVV